MDTKSFHTTGECHADDFVVQDRTANTWNAEGFAADVTAAGSITTGTTFGVTATGKITVTGNSNTGTNDLQLVTSGASSELDITSANLLSVTAANDLIMTSNGLTGILLQSTDAGSTFTIDAANDYDELVGGDLTVDGNTAVDDTASGVGHGRVISLSDLASNNENRAAIWAYSVA